MFLKDNWTTFFKSRLNCSLPGEYPVYFDRIGMFIWQTNKCYNNKVSHGIKKYKLQEIWDKYTAILEISLIFCLEILTLLMDNCYEGWNISNVCEFVYQNRYPKDALFI